MLQLHVIHDARLIAARRIGGNCDRLRSRRRHAVVARVFVYLTALEGKVLVVPVVVDTRLAQVL